MKGNLINLKEGIDEMPTLTRGQLLTKSICVLYATESIRKPRPSHHQLQIGTCHRCIPSSSRRIKSCAVSAADLQHPGKVLCEDQKCRACAQGKVGRTALQTGIFRSQFYEPNSCISYMMTSAPHDCRNLLQKICA